MSTTHPYEPDFAIHPGETLLETLAAIGMSQKELAERTGRPLKTVNEIIQGKAAITADTALQLERVLGVAASFWNNAQRNYEAQLARIAETEALRRDVAWLKEFPLSRMSKMGWVPKRADPIEQLRAVLSFFGVAGVEEWRQLWQQPEVVFRKSRAFAAHPQSVAAWLRAGEREAQQIATQPFDKDKFSAALHEIRRHTTSEPETFPRGRGHPRLWCHPLAHVGKGHHSTQPARQGRRLPVVHLLSRGSPPPQARQTGCVY
jgi:HTH-type transcriptional regulator/antitoxin HigA